MLKKALTNVDLLAGLGAGAWSVAALYATKLAILCDPVVSFTFCVAALGRGILALRAGNE